MVLAPIWGSGPPFYEKALACRPSRPDQRVAHARAAHWRAFAVDPDMRVDVLSVVRAGGGTPGSPVRLIAVAKRWHVGRIPFHLVPRRGGL